MSATVSQITILLSVCKLFVYWHFELGVILQLNVASNSSSGTKQTRRQFHSQSCTPVNELRLFTDAPHYRRVVMMRGRGGGQWRSVLYFDTFWSDASLNDDVKWINDVSLHYSELKTENREWIGKRITWYAEVGVDLRVALGHCNKGWKIQSLVQR